MGKVVVGGTLDKVGVTTETVKSGATPTSTRRSPRFTPEQRDEGSVEYMQGFYQNFVAKVASVTAH